jgi:phytoene synthase
MKTPLNEAYRHCEEVVQEHAKNFKYSFVFLPPEKISDNEIPLADKLRGLAEVRHKLAAGSTDGPLWTALADTLARFPIPQRVFEYIIEGVEQDLTVFRYEVFGQLREYCFRVASAVGLASLEVFQYSNPAALDYGVDLGIAMQLTNIIRDVGEDADRGRIYLPLEDLRRFRVSEELILNSRRPTPEFLELMKFQAVRARDYFERARPLPSYLPRHSRSCPMVLSAVYRELLDTIEDEGFPVLERRVRVSTPRKVSLMLTTLIRSWL